MPRTPPLLYRFHGSPAVRPTIDELPSVRRPGGSYEVVTDFRAWLREAVPVSVVSFSALVAIQDAQL